MEDPNEEWRIQEYGPPEKNDSRLKRIWHGGLNLGKKIALTGIVVSAAPLALPPLVVLSAFGVAFTVPFGFFFASYAATDKLMSTLLSKPKPPPPPLLLEYERVSSDGAEEEAYEYDDGKVKEESYEEDYDLEEEEKALEDNNKIQDDSRFARGISSQLGIDEDLKDIGEVIVDNVEEDVYEDASEYVEKKEPTSDVAREILKGIREAEEEISSMGDGPGEMLGNGVEAVVVSAEAGGENDIDVEQVDEVDVVGTEVSTEDSIPKVKFGDVVPEELERETKGMIESIRDEGKSETKTPPHSMEKASPSVSRESNEDVDDIKQVGVPSGKETAGDLVRLQNDSGPVERKFGDFEPRESEREKMQILETTWDMDKAENENHQKSTEKTSLAPSVSGEELSNFENLEQLTLPSEKETVDINAGLQKRRDTVRRSENNEEDVVVSTKEETRNRGDDTMFVIPEEVEPEGTNHTIGSNGGGSGGGGGAVAVEENPVCAKQLVVHVKKSGDHKATDIHEVTDLNIVREALIFVSADMRVSATESGVDLLGQDNSAGDHHTRPAGDHPGGVDLSSGDLPDANLHDYELPSLAEASTSEPLEGLIREDNTWKQINAMRAILGYEAAAQTSCVEELKALYVFTGVDPPASINEPSSIADINEKLEFLMAIVGVKKSTV